MFNKTPLALAFATLICAPSIYAIVSVGTPPVVGFKPVFTNKPDDMLSSGALTGSMVLGGSVSFDPKKIANILGFTDRDGDQPDVANFKYSWTVDGDELSDTGTLTLPKDMALLGKQVILTITPVSLSGQPLTGNPHVFDTFKPIGAMPVEIVAEAENVLLSGTLEVGKNLTASYQFKLGLYEIIAPGVPKSGTLPSQLVEDHSIFVWGKKDKWSGTSIQAKNLMEQEIDRSHPNVIKVSGQVPAYTIRKEDVGEVLELTILPRTQNIAPDRRLALGIHDFSDWYLRPAREVSLVTVTTDEPSGAGLIDHNKDGKVSWAPVEPRDVRIKFISSATVAVNGVDGVRPVAAKDELKATFTPAANASPNASDYTFQWVAAGNKIGTAEVGKDTFTPGPQYQGKPIWVDVLPAKKAVP